MTAPQDAPKQPRTFPTDVIISAATGRLVTRHFSEVHRLVEHMAGGPVWTHQLPDAMDALAPGLRGQLPWLAEVAPPEEFRDEAHVFSWAAEQAGRHGAEHEVAVIEGGWSRDPIADLVDRVGAERVLPVVVGPANEGAQAV